jgi:hypothetical protein
MTFFFLFSPAGKVKTKRRNERGRGTRVDGFNRIIPLLSCLFGNVGRKTEGRIRKIMFRSTGEGGDMWRERGDKDFFRTGGWFEANEPVE